MSERTDDLTIAKQENPRHLETVTVPPSGPMPVHGASTPRYQLMLEACPYLTVNEIKQILYDTAVDLGDPGKDNDYGGGMIDALAAVNMALDVCSPRPPHAWDGSHATEVNTPLTVRLRTLDDGLPDPPGMLSHVMTTLPVSGVLRDPGADVITDVPYVLVVGGDQVIYDPYPYYQGPDGFGFLASDGGEPVPPEYCVLIAGKGLTHFEWIGRIGYDEPSQTPN